MGFTPISTSRVTNLLSPPVIDPKKRKVPKRQIFELSETVGKKADFLKPMTAISPEMVDSEDEKEAQINTSTQEFFNNASFSVIDQMYLDNLENSQKVEEEDLEADMKILQQIKQNLGSFTIPKSQYVGNSQLLEKSRMENTSSKRGETTTSVIDAKFYAELVQDVSEDWVSSDDAGVVKNKSTVEVLENKVQKPYKNFHNFATPNKSKKAVPKNNFTEQDLDLFFKPGMETNIGESSKATNAFQGFTTGNGKSIQINKEFMLKGINIFADDDLKSFLGKESSREDDDKSTKLGFTTANNFANNSNEKKVDKVGEESKIAPSQKYVFTAASGKKIEVECAIVEEIEELDDSWADDEAIELKLGLTKGKPVDSKKENIDSKSSTFGFTSGKGKPICINSKAVEKSAKLYDNLCKDSTSKEKPETDWGNSKNMGFTTGNGTNISIGSKSLEKAQKLFDNLDENSKSSKLGFTGKGKNVSAAHRNSEKAQALYNLCKGRILEEKEPLPSTSKETPKIPVEDNKKLENNLKQCKTSTFQQNARQDENSNLQSTHSWPLNDSEIEEAFNSMSSPQTEKVEDFRGFGKAEIEASAQLMQKCKANLALKERNSLDSQKSTTLKQEKIAAHFPSLENKFCGNFAGFSTGTGCQVKLSDDALKKAAALFSEKLTSDSEMMEVEENLEERLCKDMQLRKRKRENLENSSAKSKAVKLEMNKSKENEERKRTPEKVDLLEDSTTSPVIRRTSKHHFRRTGKKMQIFQKIPEDMEEEKKSSESTCEDRVGAILEQVPLCYSKIYYLNHVYNLCIT